MRGKPVYQDTGTASPRVLHSLFHGVSPVAHSINNNDVLNTPMNYRLLQRWRRNMVGMGTVLRQRSFGHFQGVELRILKVKWVLMTKRKTLHLASWLLNIPGGVKDLGFSRSLTASS